MNAPHRIFGALPKGVTPFVREGAYLIDIRKGAFCAIETPKGHYLLGGAIEEGESHEACVDRECLEEIGHGAKLSAYLGLGEFFGPTYCRIRYLHAKGHFYLGTLTDFLQPPEENDNLLVWLRPHQVNCLRLPHQRWAVRLAYALLHEREVF